MNTVKQPFTTDEMRVVLLWATAYTNQNPTDHSLGSDTLFERELLSLRDRVRDNAPAYLLGMMNAGFLLGFDTMEHAYPLQDVWNNIVENSAEVPYESIVKLGTFLEDAGFIERNTTANATKTETYVE